jgi:hypothetical protein
VDAREFHSAVVEGLRQLSLGDHAAAHIKLDRARTLYAGSYLPGINGKIIANTRNELESLYRTASMESAHNTGRNHSEGGPERSDAKGQDLENIDPALILKSFPAGK